MAPNLDSHKPLIDAGALKSMFMLIKLNDLKIQRQAATALRDISANEEHKLKFVEEGAIYVITIVTRCTDRTCTGSTSCTSCHGTSVTCTNILCTYSISWSSTSCFFCKSDNYNYICSQRRFLIYLHTPVAVAAACRSLSVVKIVVVVVDAVAVVAVVVVVLVAVAFVLVVHHRFFFLLVLLKDCVAVNNNFKISHF